ncbi:MAG: hypothetical protein NUV60_03655 [Patescibacteria group bacterium]|nr:hypothetical protein [Patescibacteria group bacterium]
MKIVDTGYGNSSDLMEARRKALNEKPFRYLVVTTSGRIPGSLGGSFNFEIHGSNNIRELLKPKRIRDADEIIDTKTDKNLGKELLAKQYLETLSARERENLVDEMLVAFLTK